MPLYFIKVEKYVARMTGKSAVELKKTHLY
jgi:hypothetical protein